jgi:hypothetical protein
LATSSTYPNAQQQFEPAHFVKPSSKSSGEIALILFAGAHMGPLMDAAAHATLAQVALHMQAWSMEGRAPWERETQLLREAVAVLQTGMLPPVIGERTPVTDSRRIALRGFHAMEAWDAWSAAARCSAIFRCSPRAGDARGW